MSVPAEPATAAGSAPRVAPIPIAPSLVSQMGEPPFERPRFVVDRRVVQITLIAALVGVAAAFIAQILTVSIAFVTQLAFYGTVSTAEVSPAHNTLGGWVVLVPVLGAVVIGIMARFGSSAIRGHGIPEAMEQVLFNQSRIPARVLFLKPLSAVISIGTGGPFGAEGPIIATGGALGSLVGQYTKITPDERKALLAAGAAAGMAATFGSPVAAVLLAIELLLFEYRPRSLIPVAMAAVAATAMRLAIHGTAPAFAVTDLLMPSAGAVGGYVVVGLVAGLASVWVTKAVYAVEDAFERRPIHWMWWPALGAIPVGLIGIFAPRTMGVGYDNIEDMVSGNFSASALAILCGCKLVSWLFSLGSGTSGGTLAPLFTIGGGVGAGIAAALALIVPAAGIDVRMGALVGMAALFAGASRALLASVVFAFEATHQQVALLPLLAGCGAAYLVSCLMMKTSIMTEKIARRGRPIPSEYAADHLEQVLVRDVAMRDVHTFKAHDTIAAMQAWLRSGSPATRHHGFPVLDAGGDAIGVLTQRDIFAATDTEATVGSLVKRPPVCVAPTTTLREAADTMLRLGVGRLPVMEDGRLAGIVTRTDLLEGHADRLVSANQRGRDRRIGLAR